MFTTNTMIVVLLVFTLSTLMVDCSLTTIHNDKDQTQASIEFITRRGKNRASRKKTSRKLAKLMDAVRKVVKTNVKVVKYKVIFYTMDHELPEVKEWMEKGFDAWTNPEINDHLRNHGCPTLKFVQTNGDDFDFTINFDIEFFNKLGQDVSERYLFWPSKRNKSIFINDGMDIQRPWIAHAIAYGTCKILGCKCTRHSDRELMFCGQTIGREWLIYQPTGHDYRTMGAALGCQTLDRW